MSNQVVGSVYQAVIDKVIAASTNDFEEFGIDPGTLTEMRNGWQEKLSSLKVASFPWDPQPEPPRQPPTVPSNVKQEPDLSPAVSAPQQEHVNFPNVPIKTERGYDAPVTAYQSMPNNGYPGGLNGDLAQQRAHALVAQRFGQAPHNMQIPQQHGAQPMHAQQRMMQGQHQQRLPQQMPQRPPQNHMYNSQTDGADELEQWKQMVALRRAEAEAPENGRVAADNFIRARVDAMAARQDSGLMMPLNAMPKGEKRKAIVRALLEEEAETASASARDLLPVAPFDGELEKEPEEDPDDAINSELDDPEDEAGADGDSDDETMDYMLCTYDKVQRVKNKWKCTLKDGILTTNKKEFLFHKANGEFEW